MREKIPSSPMVIGDEEEDVDVNLKKTPTRFFFGHFFTHYLRQGLVTFEEICVREFWECS